MSKTDSRDKLRDALPEQLRHTFDEFVSDLEMNVQDAQDERDQFAADAENRADVLENIADRLRDALDSGKYIYAAEARRLLRTVEDAL